ncbi:MAG: type III-B CRISPR module RAMP protein Cmr6 [Bryobacteraceae bacterium]
MPVAAVPKYLPVAQFQNASPALRFGLLLSVWTDRRDQEKEVLDRASRRSREAEQLKQRLGPNNRNLAQAIDEMVRDEKLPALWEKNDQAAREAWGKVAALTEGDLRLMRALADRQKSLAALRPAKQVWRCEATATAPFTTGLGNEHPLENGFSFLNPYGLPYLPGSGVKGVVREAARQLATGMWEDSRGWHTEPVGAFTVREDGEERKIALTALDVLFGRETPEGESDHFRGVLTFWDVVPVIQEKSLRVEVMTPHQSHYYQQKTDRKSGDSKSPHDSGQPNPILFLTVPPGAEFAFHVVCDLPRLKRVAPALLGEVEPGKEPLWKQLLEAAFEHAFQWLGFGAKTAVGYGAMQRAAAPAAPAGGQPKAGASAAPQGQSNKPAQEAFAANEQIWENATLQWNPGKQELTALSADLKSKAALLQKAAQDFLANLPEQQREQLKSKKKLAGVKVRVQVEGNKFTLLGLA